MRFLYNAVQIVPYNAVQINRVIEGLTLQIVTKLLDHPPYPLNQKLD